MHPEPNEQLIADLPPAFREIVKSIGLLRRIMDPFFSRYGLSGAQWAVLRTLHRAEREGIHELHLSDLSDRLLVRSPSMTHVIERLRRAGLVSRRASSKDLRAKRVGLTPAGRQRVLDMQVAHGQQVQTALAPLDVAEQAALAALLGKLTTYWNTLAGDVEIIDDADESLPEDHPTLAHEQASQNKALEQL